MIKASLRICIDVSAAVHHRAGLGRYAHELVKGLGRGEAFSQETRSSETLATAETPSSRSSYENASPLHYVKMAFFNDYVYQKNAILHIINNI